MPPDAGVAGARGQFGEFVQEGRQVLRQSQVAQSQAQEFLPAVAVVAQGRLVDADKGERRLVVGENGGGIALEEEAVLVFGGVDAGQGLFQFSGARAHQLLQVVEIGLGLAGQAPLFRQCNGQLLDLNVVEGLFEHQQLVAALQAAGDVLQRVFGGGGAEDDFQGGVRLPEMADGFDAVPAGRRAHIYKGQGVRAALRGGARHLLQALRALPRAIQIEARQDKAGSGRGGRFRLHPGPLAGLRVVGRQNLAELLVDVRVFVNNQDAIGFMGLHQMLFLSSARSQENRLGVTPLSRLMS